VNKKFGLVLRLLDEIDVIEDYRWSPLFFILFFINNQANIVGEEHKYINLHILGWYQYYYSYLLETKTPKQKFGLISKISSFFPSFLLQIPGLWI
jgi:hypothetical protein